MKVGDLVRWTHPSEPDVGIIMGIDHDEVEIMWSKHPGPWAYHFILDINLEVIHESR